MLKPLRALLSAAALSLLLPALAAADSDLEVSKTDSPDPVTAGTNLTYTITLNNNGPDPADNASLNDFLPAGTTFVSLTAPAGWTCSTPAVGADGIVSCSLNPLPVGSAVFTLVVAVDPSVSAGTEITNTAAAFSDSPDPNPENEVGNATTTVAASADLSVTKVDDPDPVPAGTPLSYTITVSNGGPSYAAGASLSDTLPAGTTFQSLAAPAGWTCSTPAVGATGAVSCSTASFALGSAVFTLGVEVDPSVSGGTVLTNTATVSSDTPDPDSGDDSASAGTTVVSGAVVSATKVVSGSFDAGDSVTYTVVLTNTAGNSQPDNPEDEFTDVLPPQLTLVSAGATSGMPVATVATNTVTWNGSIAAGGSVTITIQAVINPGVAPGTLVSNQGTVTYDTDGDGTNEATGVTDDPAVGGTDDPTVFVVGAVILGIPTLSEGGLALLVLLLASGGAVLLRRRRARP